MEHTVQQLYLAELFHEKEQLKSHQEEIKSAKRELEETKGEEEEIELRIRNQKAEHAQATKVSISIALLVPYGHATLKGRILASILHPLLRSLLLMVELIQAVTAAEKKVTNARKEVESLAPKIIKG